MVMHLCHTFMGRLLEAPQFCSFVRSVVNAPGAAQPIVCSLAHDDILPVPCPVLLHLKVQHSCFSPDLHVMSQSHDCNNLML